VIATGRSGQRRVRALDPDAGKAVKPDHLDQRPDLGLGAAEQHVAPVRPQAAGEHREVKHQRRVRENKFAEIDDDVPLGVQRADQRLPAATLSGPILVAAAAKNCGLVLKVDDRGNLSQVD
jgi:hypothetical protein